MMVSCLQFWQAAAVAATATVSSKSLKKDAAYDEDYREDYSPHMREDERRESWRERENEHREIQHERERENEHREREDEFRERHEHERPHREMREREFDHHVEVDNEGRMNEFHQERRAQEIQQQHHVESMRKQHSLMQTSPEGPGAGGERGNGAPSEGWVPCGHYKKVDGVEVMDACECARGQMRFGLKKQDLWTFPVQLGSEPFLECSIEALQNARVHVKDNAGAETPRSCQCAERTIKISAVVPSSASSFVERRSGLSATEEEAHREDPVAEAPAGLYEGGADSVVCLMVPHLSESLAQMSLMQAKSEAQFNHDALKLLHYSMATEVESHICSETDEGQVWQFLQSTGQIRHSQSGKCLGAWFDSGTPHLRAQDCAWMESQALTQRWEMKFYVSGDGADFEGGEGKILLGYGAKTADPYCLTPQPLDVLPTIEKCSSAAGKVWKIDVPVGLSHQWETCGQETATCACTGEVRFGEGETNTWASAVPVPNIMEESQPLKCELQDLRDHIVKDPITIPDIEEPDVRDCQCKPGPEEPKPNNVDKGKEAGASNIGLIGGGAGAGVVLIAVGAYFATKKKEGDYEEDGELEEEDWEEEEYEEE